MARKSKRKAGSIVRVCGGTRTEGKIAKSMLWKSAPCNGGSLRSQKPRGLTKCNKRMYRTECVVSVNEALLRGQTYDYKLAVLMHKFRGE